MRELHQILREKEQDLARVRREVEALRFVAPLLLEREILEPSVELPPIEFSTPEMPSRNRWPLTVS